MVISSLYPFYIRDAIKLRYSLVPYFYSLLHEASTSGAPIMRPLVYEFQNDPKTFEENFEFMLGPSLLVANVLDKGVDHLDVYLPVGAQWFDLRTKEYIEGGSTVRVPVDLSSIPMFLRVGSVIPRSPELTNIHNQVIDHLDMLIEPNTDVNFTLYEDDGVSQDYKRGKFLETTFNVTTNSDGVLVDVNRSGDFETRVTDMKLSVICKRMAPLEVHVGSALIDRYLNFDEFTNAETGWFFDGQSKQALVKYKNPSEKNYRVDIGFSVKDLISI